jgi:hypothetical protein
MIIIAATPYRRKSGRIIHANCRIAVPHFEVDAADTRRPGALKKIVEKHPPDTAALFAWKHCNEKELGLVCNGANERKAENLAG